MNIAILTDSFPPMIDGVSRCALGYASALHEGNYGNCIVIAPEMPKVEYEYPFPIYTYKSLRLPYAEYRAGHPFTPRLIARLKALNIDILHVHSPFLSMTVARQLRRFLNIPIVFTQHTKWGFDIACAVSNKALRKMVEVYAYNNIDAADEVWAVSRGAGEYLRSQGYKGEFKVMPNGTDFPSCEPDSSLTLEINSRFDLPGDVPVFLFVGRMMWYKNIRLIIEALGILRRRSIDFRMLFVGEGDDLADIITLTEDEGLSDAVFFAGKISNRELLRAYFSRCDLFVFPSVYDNAPLVIKEAAACSCPSVVVRGSSASEILEDGVSGFFADESAQSIADAVLDALSDRERLERVSEAAFEQVYVTWDKVIQESAARYEVVKAAFDRSYAGRAKPAKSYRKVSLL